MYTMGVDVGSASSKVVILEDGIRVVTEKLFSSVQVHQVLSVFLRKLLKQADSEWKIWPE